MIKIMRSTAMHEIVASILIAFAISLLIPAIASAVSLSRQLEIGMSGSDVSSLQSFLADDNTIYPEALVTGYFGPLTRAAVMRFQARNGIDQVGRVGPITLGVINSQMAGAPAPGGDVTVPVIVGLTVNVAKNSINLSWITNEPTRGTVYYSTSPLSEYEGTGGVTIGGTAARTDTALRNSQNIIISGLQPNTSYYYDVYVTDAAGNNTMTMQTTFKTTN